jgi:poly(ADP-ribose) glycohydrolase ARH3
MHTISDRFAGCLLGLAVGDAVAAPFEGLDGYAIHRDFGGAAGIVREPPLAELCYTDDTEMAIGVAECLVRLGRIDPDVLAEIFAANFDRRRGYGPGAATILVGMGQGHRWQDLVTSVYPNGSYGNGAAMRVAPVGLAFHDDVDRVAAEAAASASVTHAHPLGVDGAVVMASAVALLVTDEPFDHGAYCMRLAGLARTEEFRWQLKTAAKLGAGDSIPFGSGIEAHRSVVSAICCFGLTPNRYEDVVTRALGLGGDVDTVAAMAGALAGTHLGIGGVPSRLIDRLENGRWGREAIGRLAGRLAGVAQARSAGVGS